MSAIPLRTSPGRNPFAQHPFGHHAFAHHPLGSLGSNPTSPEPPLGPPLPLKQDAGRPRARRVAPGGASQALAAHKPQHIRLAHLGNTSDGAEYRCVQPSASRRGDGVAGGAESLQMEDSST